MKVPHFYKFKENSIAKSVGTKKERTSTKKTLCSLLRFF